MTLNQVSLPTDLDPRTFGKFLIFVSILVPGVKTVHDDIEHLLINRTWKPTLCVIGVDGIPDLAHAGNVLRPYTAIKLSIRYVITLLTIVMRRQPTTFLPFFHLRDNLCGADLTLQFYNLQLPSYQLILNTFAHLIIDSDTQLRCLEFLRV